jgi:hypothetical protein
MMSFWPEKHLIGDTLTLILLFTFEACVVNTVMR